MAIFGRMRMPCLEWRNLQSNQSMNGRSSDRKAYGSFCDLQASSLHARAGAFGKSAKPFQAGLFEFRGIAAKDLGNDPPWRRVQVQPVCDSGRRGFGFRQPSCVQDCQTRIGNKFSRSAQSAFPCQLNGGTTGRTDRLRKRIKQEDARSAKENRTPCR